MSRKPAELLDALLAVYWRGKVMQGEAAKLVGIRKEDFAELAELRMGEAALDRVVWAYYLRAFHRSFPNCDVKLCRQRRFATTPAVDSDDLGSEPTAKEIELLTPPNPSLREVVPTTYKPDPEVARYLKENPVPLYLRFQELETEGDSGRELELDFNR